MLYYEFKLTGDKPFLVPDGYSEKYDWLKEISFKTSELNRAGNYNVRFFMSEAKADHLTICAAIGYKNKNDLKKLALDFAKGLGFKASRAEAKEISMDTMIQRVKRADSKDYIESERDFLSSILLDTIDDCSEGCFTEVIVEDSLTIETAKERAAKTNCGLALEEELDRIYTASSQQTFIGNPVQYMIITDDWNVAKDISVLLATALYQNKRLKSRRLVLIKPEVDKRYECFTGDSREELNMDVINSLYTIQKGCSLVVKPGRFADDECFVREGELHVDPLARLIRENNVETLSIMVFSKVEKRYAQRLMVSLPKVRFVEIEEHPFPASKARELLKEKAKEDGIEKISGLLSRIEDKDRFYYISDVCRIYRTWQNERLAVEVYPQYKNVYTTIGSCKKTEGNAYSELQSLIGLGSAKQVIQQALDYNRAQFLYEKAGLKKLDTTKHMVFTGNPGTAKTTVARLFAQIMKDNRVLSRGNLIEVGRQDLVGKYVGWTAKCVEEAFDNAMGSVLFIDEAYSLFEAEGGYYGDEAINTIVQLMENRRDNTIVIFAGYPDKMQQFLDRNPGLRSRIAFHVNFDDYSTEELVDIFRLMASKGEMNLAPGVEDKVFSIFNEARKRSDFGNGRYVRNIFEQARMKQASRIVKIPEDQLTDNAIRTLVAEDFDSIQSSQPMHDRCHIGFAC